jgi:xanthine dehydrogenase small subunit
MVSDTIQFVYNNEIHKIKNPDPNKTILDYIRSDLKKTGTKEGCSEGGCGACTIVLGELKNNKIVYKSINSCISFLPSIDSKHLILIENLISQENKLHPIQEAMVKFHGSQCGFCTPGFVMSLFAMYKTHKKFNKEIIDESLSGNLCRCTGYRPIIDAAKSLRNKKDNDHFKKDQGKIIALLKKIKVKEIEISFKRRKYYAPRSLSSLKKILKQNLDANFLSGGTDLSLEVTKLRKEIKKTVSLNSIKELKFIKKNKNFLEIGAGVSLLEFQNIIKSYYLDFYNILKRYGSIQIRNVATIAGNIATASPIGDTIPLLLSLDSEIKIQNGNSIKLIPLSEFFISYRKTKLKRGEFLYSVRIPINNKNYFKAYKISKRFDDDISSVCASFNFLIKKNKILKAKIAYGGMSEIPKRALSLEKELINSVFSEKTFIKAGNLIDKDFSPIDDMRASRNYRINIAKNLLMKFFYEINSNKNIRVNS